MEKPPATVTVVGYNPFRKQVRRPSDVVFVAAALVLTLAAVLWALLG